MIHNLISMKHSTKNYCFGDHIIFRFIFNYFGKFPALAIKFIKTMLSIYNIFSMHNNITNFGI